MKMVPTGVATDTRARHLVNTFLSRARALQGESPQIVAELREPFMMLLLAAFCFCAAVLFFSPVDAAVLAGATMF